MQQVQATLKRPLNPMPTFVREALEAKKLLAAYEARPPYQRNDYLGWIARAKLPTTQHKRLAQMLDELQRGDVYMKMAWRTATADFPPKQRWSAPRRARSLHDG